MLNKISLTIFLVLFTVASGHAQQIKNGGLSGTIMSFTGMTSGSKATRLFTTPEGDKAGYFLLTQKAGRFILTQFCGHHGSVSNRLLLKGSMESLS